MNKVETVKIPISHFRLLRPSGYFQRFYELLPIYQNHRKAFEAVEGELYDSFQVTRYSTYQSFKSNKSTYLNIINGNRI